MRLTQEASYQTLWTIKTMIPQETQIKQVKTKAEYIVAAEDMLSGIKNLDDLGKINSFVAVAQVFATLAISAPPDPEPSLEHAEAVSALAGVNELLDAILSGLTYMYVNRNTPSVIRERVETMRMLIRAWRGELGQ